MNFVIFHGSYNNPEGNWFPYLKNKLEELGQKVWAPAFPVDDWDSVVEKGEGYFSPIQNLTNWMSTFEKDVLPQLPKENLVFVGHSISPVFILHLVDHFNLQLDSAFFVAPFLSTLPQWEFNAVNETFYKTDFDFEKLKKLIPLSYAIYGDDDPYVPEEKFTEWIQLVGSKPIVVHKGGHLGGDYKEFPQLLELIKKEIHL